MARAAKAARIVREENMLIRDLSTSMRLAEKIVGKDGNGAKQRVLPVTMSSDLL